MKIIFKHLFISIFIFAFFSCATNKKYVNISIREIVFEPNWENICEGIQYAKEEYSKLPLIIHILKIDLKNKNINIVNTPPDRFKESGKVYPETVMSFAKRENTEAAMNACFFKYRTPLDRIYASLGIHIHKGEILSPPIPRLASLCFTKDRLVFITSNQNKTSFPSEIIYAVSGFNKILENGKAVNLKNEVPDSRTIAGTDIEKKILFVLFAEGENKYKSRGVSISEAVFLMQKLGAFEAIQLDGGGSSSLVIKRNRKLVRVVPSCIFNVRKTACNLGFIKIN